MVGLFVGLFVGLLDSAFVGDEGGLSAGALPVAAGEVAGASVDAAAACAWKFSFSTTTLI